MGKKSWELDHIIPLSLFNLHNINDQLIAFNWTNIQPLEKRDNLQKYNNFRPHEYFSSIINIHRFIFKYKIDHTSYNNIKKSLQWIKSKYNCDTFKLRETP